MFAAALFTIARTGKQPKRPSTEKRIKKTVVHIYNRVSLSHRKEQTHASCSNTDGRWDCHTEWSETQERRMTDTAYTRNLKKCKWACSQNRREPQMQKTNVVARAQGGGRTWETGTDTDIPLHIKWWLTQTYCIAQGTALHNGLLWEKNLKKEWILCSVCMTDSLRYTPETNTAR